MLLSLFTFNLPTAPNANHDPSVKFIDASKCTKRTSIGGNELANSIVGGSGNDFINTGYGADTVLGGAGNDTFIYRANEGTDRIMDYASGDMLKILKRNGKAGRFTSSKFDSGTLPLGISGGGNVIFENVMTSTTFNINNKSYKISGSRLVKK